MLTERSRLYRTEGKGLSYAESDRTLTAMKRDPDLAFLSEVSSVPLQQALRHQHRAFQAFFAKRTRYPRFKSRYGRQAATYTHSAFRMKDGALWLAKNVSPLRFVWTWPDIDVTLLDPIMVTVAKDPAGRWFVTFSAAGLAVTACGGDVRRTGATRAQLPRKQEPQGVSPGIPVL
jgi:putative transposase